MKQEIAIVGASGFVGRGLCRLLADSGYMVVGYGRTRHPQLSEQVEFVRRDVTSEQIELRPNTKAVFYLAQSSHYRDFPRQADSLLQVNVVGAVQAARAAVEVGAQFFCYASTGNVYQPSFEPLREHDPLRHDNGYALSKVMAEKMLALVSENMPLMIARIFGAYGPGQEQMLVPNIAHRIRSGEGIQLAPSGAEPEDRDGLRISLCYIDDLVACLKTAMENTWDGATPPGVLNVAGPEPVSLRRLAETIGQVIGREPVFELGTVPRSFDLIADIGRLQELVSPTFTPLNVGLAATYGHGQRKVA